MLIAKSYEIALKTNRFEQVQKMRTQNRFENIMFSQWSRGAQSEHAEIALKTKRLDTGQGGEKSHVLKSL